MKGCHIWTHLPPSRQEPVLNAGKTQLCKELPGHGTCTYTESQKYRFDIYSSITEICTSSHKQTGEKHPCGTAEYYRTSFPTVGILPTVGIFFFPLRNFCLKTRNKSMLPDFFFPLHKHIRWWSWAPICATILALSLPTIQLHLLL